jgi:signal transduction histidine kinase
MGEPALTHRRAREDGARDQPEPLDPFIAAARQRGFHTFRVFGTAAGAISVVTVLPRVLRGGPGTVGLAGVLGLALAFGVAAWIAPARHNGLSTAFVLATVALIAVIGTWTIGPTFSMGSLFVMVPLLAIFLYGRRLLWPTVGVTALALAGIGAASWLAGRPAVGQLAGASVPYLVYARLAVTTLGAVIIALTLAHAALGAMESSVARARASVQLAAEEQERRFAAERDLARAQRLEEIGRLASGVAHDTKNALLVLAAGLKELRSTVRGPDELAVLADLEHAVAGVNGTVQQLLSLARRQASTARPVPLADQLSQFASALRRVFPPEVELHVDCRSGAWAVLDPVLLEQALLNLALNARDAMPRGGRLTLRLRDGQGARAVLEVEDSGTGMEPATAARMFEPFFTTKPEGEGTGLGLHMVRAFVDGAGGRIEVDSAVGRGTCVRLSFPATAAPVGASA